MVVHVESKIDAQSGCMDFSVGISTIDKAIAQGHDRRLLRWRVGAAQAYAMFMCALSIAINPSPPTAFMETGMIYESGMFCGIPYAVDRSLPDDRVLLERLEPAPVTEIHNLSVPYRYQK